MNNDRRGGSGGFRSGGSGGSRGGSGGSGGFRSGGSGGSRGGSGGFRPSGPREMHKATCADCGQETEVPFVPSGDRPVYCRECYQKHRPPKRY
ncbi:CxxC-x17-CxxC domain-containing protein [Methanomethylovorans sp.]|uniref:CxxC-x17-CxxC domain-containing protein n=1 Tax=Methanomethylovorans sp. TaxID=2758717 RepID=UPI00351C61B5